MSDGRIKEVPLSSCTPEEDPEAKMEKILEALKLREKEKELSRKLSVIENENRANKSSYIRKLHHYNDLKDATQSIIGKLAEIEGVTSRELHTRYNLPLDN